MAKSSAKLERLSFLSIEELVRRYRARSLSPVAVTENICDRIRIWNPHINAFRAVDDMGALKAARASERRWKYGRPKGLLDGVPISVKDTLQVIGYSTRKGSKLTVDTPAIENAPAVDRILEHGAVIVGTTTTPEFGVGPVTHSPLTGITRNPWDTNKGSGGSSGGAAAATAAGLCYGALGTDAGGSIRIPSSLCGVVGFKPTGGRIPVYPTSPAGSLATPGPIAHCVRDVALMLTVIAARDTRDVEGLAPDSTNYTANLEAGVKGLRIAYSETLGYAPKVEKEVASIAVAAVKIFREIGAKVKFVDPNITDPHDLFVRLFHAGALFALRDIGTEKLKLLGPIMRDALQSGRKVTLRDYLQIHEQRRALALTMARFHQRYDLLVTPMLATAAFDAERTTPKAFEKFGNMRSWTPFAYPFNLTLQPAISIPCGFTRDGLPVGLQIVGPRFSDSLVLRAANALENRLRHDSCIQRRRYPRPPVDGRLSD